MKYNVFPYFAFRTPSFPYQNLKIIEDEKNIELFLIPKIQEAIYIGSPVLFYELKKIIDGKIFDIKERNSILYAYMRYLLRMHTRCTPFGLFAGCGLGKIGNYTNIIIEDSDKQSLRLDMQFLNTLYREIIKQPTIKQNLKLFPNSSIYLIGKKYRYTVYEIKKLVRKYQIEAVEKTNYLHSILCESKNGLTISEITKAVKLLDKNLEENEIRVFIDSLIDAQILIGEFDHTIVGDDYLSHLIDLVESSDVSNQMLILLKEIQIIIENFESYRNKINVYQKIIQLVKQLKVDYNEKYLFQVDTIKNTLDAYIDKNIVKELKSTLFFLNKVIPYKENDILHHFKRNFSDRYGEKKIPLYLALDPELGIGYPPGNQPQLSSPLINDLIFPAINNNTKIDLYPFQILLHKKAIECISKHESEIVIIDEDIKDYKNDNTELPPTIFCLFEILKSKQNEILINLKFFSGSSGANLLSRFSYASSHIENFIKKITEKEAQILDEKIIAEIIHSPEERIGNILYRPHIRKYEIVYLSSSDLDREHIIDVSDLFISIQNERIVIHSKKHNKEVVPRLTNAHNFKNGLPIYRFLCDMQTAYEKDSLYIDWGNFNYFFHPRVRYKNTILSLSTWVMNKDQMKPLFGITDNHILMEEISIWRKKYNIPRYVVFTKYDNELFIDWENISTVSVFLPLINNVETCIFKEFIFNPEDAIVKDIGGNVYLNECVVSFYKDIEYDSE